MNSFVTKTSFVNELMTGFEGFNQLLLKKKTEKDRILVCLKNDTLRFCDSPPNNFSSWNPEVYVLGA